ncbi:MAG TPA: hypothetical protein VEI57_04935 [Nitrospirota bacterium]|nr:hypothetical protein [Nitrospirota bacterium]
MKYQKKIIPLLLLLLLTGCQNRRMQDDKMNDQINVFDIKLFSDVDYKEINGVVATEEPCLRGYERSFDKLDVIIGYGFNHKIRKIMTRNSTTSMFGIKPGMTYEEGKQRILQAGFGVDTPPYTFRANKYSLTFLVNGKKAIFGLTLESLD